MNKAMGALCALMLAGVAAAGPLQMNDFAYGIPLQVDGDGAIYSLPLPAEVYRQSWGGTLADIRVFNSHGEAVPHKLLRAVPRQEQAARRVTVPLYPLPTQQNQPAKEELHIAIGEDGTLVDFYGGNLPLAGAGAGEYYLLDASKIGAPIERMYLQWAGTDEALLTEVSVQGSNDLNHWQPLLSKRTIASLRHQGFTLEQHALTLPASHMNYYRIHWPPGSKGVPLRKVELELSPQYEVVPGEELVLSPQGGPAGEGDYRFDLGGHFPVNRVQLIMPQRNTVVQARLFSRGSDSEPWQLRHRGLFYDLDLEGHRLRNETVSLPPLGHGKWRLEVEQRGGGLGSGEPQLQLGWQPQRLLFIARGEMPFTLAFGRYDTRPEQLAIDPLLRRIRSEDDQGDMSKAASVGERFELGGARQLQPRAVPLPWKKWLLWAVLVLGVALLAGMVRSLYRQMRQQADEA